MEDKMPNGTREPKTHTLPPGIVQAIKAHIPDSPDIAFVIAVEYDGQPHVLGFDDSEPGGVLTTITSVYSCTLLGGTGSVCVWYVDSSGNWRRRCI